MVDIEAVANMIDFQTFLLDIERCESSGGKSVKVDRGEWYVEVLTPEGSLVVNMRYESAPPLFQFYDAQQRHLADYPSPFMDESGLYRNIRMHMLSGLTRASV